MDPVLLDEEEGVVAAALPVSDWTNIPVPPHPQTETRVWGIVDAHYESYLIK